MFKLEKNSLIKIVDQKELPNVLLEEFSTVVGGLLRNAVFYSIAAIRKNTHTLLDRFSADIDPAFVSHRVYSNPCEDTEDHIVPMICSEIGNILRQENISNHLNKETILNWTNSSNVKIDINIFNNNNFKDANFENNFLNYILSTKVEIDPENKNFKSIFNKI